MPKPLAMEEEHGALVKTNADTFRLSNDGRFAAKVSLAFEKQSNVRASDVHHSETQSAHSLHFYGCEESKMVHAGTRFSAA